MIDTTRLKQSFYFEAGKVPTEADIYEMVNVKLLQNAVMSEFENYYAGKQNILLKPTVDVTQPNNKTVVNYCKVIADFYNSYLLGKPIQYKSNDDALRTEVEAIMKYNDAHDVDVINNQQANILGGAAEQIYIDSKGKVRFANVDYRNVIFVYNKDMEKELNSVIKFFKYLPTDPYYSLELWTPTYVIKYRMDEGVAHLTTVEAKKPHSFTMVPFVEYVNNDFHTSSFAPIMGLQDAYNMLCSLEIDDYEAFVDSFLGIYNAAGTKSEDIAAMKQNRVLLLDGESKAEWITKNCNPAQIEEIKTSILDSIHEVASLPDLTDQNFASNASGVAIKYKMVGAESVAAKQERKAKRAIQKRIELIVDYLNFLNGTSYDYTSVDITFNRNMIGADQEVCDQIALLYGKVPIKNLAAKLSFITDADLEAMPEGVATTAKVGM